ncbi:MAG: hypothetical protein LC768_12965 [Acidobacteria bacterium]|nr:hypothetical protein [Acidobacteriota bacterium]MCA1639221.1 hypothetical protein [Acidobacteriota bacterium]
MFTLRIDDELELALQYENRVEEAFALIMANYDHIHEWSSWLNEDFTIEKAREFCKLHEKNFADGDGGLRIIYQGKIAGATGFHEINRKDKSAESATGWRKNLQAKV